MRVVSLSVLLVFIMVVMFVYPIYDSKKDDIKRNKCFELFHELYPRTKFCPGKESESLCRKCKHYMKNNKYKVELIPENEREIKGFEINE